MDEPDRCVFLQEVAPFAGWSEPRIAALASACCELEVDAGTILSRPDAYAAEVFIVVGGALAVELPDRSRHVLRRGNVGAHKRATVTALEPATLLSISRHELERLERSDETQP